MNDSNYTVEEILNIAKDFGFIKLYIDDNLLYDALECNSFKEYRNILYHIKDKYGKKRISKFSIEIVEFYNSIVYIYICK